MFDPLSYRGFESDDILVVTDVKVIQFLALFKIMSSQSTKRTDQQEEQQSKPTTRKYFQGHKATVHEDTELDQFESRIKLRVQVITDFDMDISFLNRVGVILSDDTVLGIIVLAPGDF